MKQIPAALSGVVVVERAGRLSTAVCGNLLASLGAHVVRIDTEVGLHEEEKSTPAQQLITLAGKTSFLVDAKNDDDEWIPPPLLQVADVVLLDVPPAQAPDRAFVDRLIARHPAAQIICVISPLGLDEIKALPTDVGEPILQALSGVLATTGTDGGAPQCVGVPIAEMCAGVNSATAILAALGVREKCGAGQLIDTSIIEVMADQIRTYLPLVMAGAGRGYRLGCQHPSNSPWNCYRARDKWVFICTGSEAHWRSTANLLGRPELIEDPRFSTRVARRKHVATLNEILALWVAGRSANEVITAFLKLGIPAGRALNIPDVLKDEELAARGMVTELKLANGGSSHFLPGSVLHLSRTPGVAPTVISPPVSDPVRTLPKDHTPLSVPLSLPILPLTGVRVVELTRYIAGPVCGAVLASLGAEVIKIEPPEGEDCRAWAPRFSGVGGYFANYNIGKRSVALDLRSPSGRDALWKLLENADVVLQNYKPGGLERMGFGAGPVTQRHPKIIYCSVSGYGASGPMTPALDTVMQGEGALTSLIGDGSEVLRVGTPVADMLSGQFATLGILAALAEQKRSGSGQVVDISMRDAIVWLTQLAWPDGRMPVNAWSIHRVFDGWVVAQADNETAHAALAGRDTDDMSTRDLTISFLEAGIHAAQVLELDEVMKNSERSPRASLYRVETGQGEPIPVLAVPLGLRGTPPIRHVEVAVLGKDNETLLGVAFGLQQTADDGCVQSKIKQS